MPSSSAAAGNEMPSDSNHVLQKLWGRLFQTSDSESREPRLRDSLLQTSDGMRLVLDTLRCGALAVRDDANVVGVRCAPNSSTQRVQVISLPRAGNIFKTLLDQLVGATILVPLEQNVPHGTEGGELELLLERYAVNPAMNDMMTVVCVGVDGNLAPPESHSALAALLALFSLKVCMPVSKGLILVRDSTFFPRLSECEPYVAELVRKSARDALQCLPLGVLVECEDGTTRMRGLCCPELGTFLRTKCSSLETLRSIVCRFDSAPQPASCSNSLRQAAPPLSRVSRSTFSAFMLRSSLGWIATGVNSDVSAEPSSENETTVYYVRQQQTNHCCRTARLHSLVGTVGDISVLASTLDSESSLSRWVVQQQNLECVGDSEEEQEDESTTAKGGSIASSRVGSPSFGRSVSSFVQPAAARQTAQGAERPSSLGRRWSRSTAVAEEKPEPARTPGASVARNEHAIEQIGSLVRAVRWFDRLHCENERIAELKNLVGKEAISSATLMDGREAVEAAIRAAQMHDQHEFQ